MASSRCIAILKNKFFFMHAAFKSACISSEVYLLIMYGVKSMLEMERI